MSDLISRQKAKDAIDMALDHIDHVPTWVYDNLLNVLNEVPSVKPTHPTPSNTLGTLDCVDRNEAIKNLEQYKDLFSRDDGDRERYVLTRVIKELKAMPSAQMDRDIPIKPIETTNKAWGIPHKQAVCPKCDCYLSHISFLGDYKGKRITYCETCGQAIDWEGWDWDE